MARASLEELLLDYTDYLRVRDLKLWGKNSKEARFVRDLGVAAHVTFDAYRKFVETHPAEVVANIVIGVIHQANYTLDKQIRRLEQDFLMECGIRERMTKVRLQHRKRQ